MFRISFSNFPDDDVIESKKNNPKFGLACARALFSRMDTESNHRLTELYAAGNQPQDKYKYSNQRKAKSGKPIINADVYADVARNKEYAKNLSKIDYTISSPAPKCVSALLSTMAERHYVPVADFVDKASIKKKDKKKFSVYATSKIINPMLKGMGLPTIRVPFEPIDLGHLEVMAKTGAFQLEEEAALEKIAKAGFSASQWPKTRTEVNRSAIIHHMMCAKIYDDPITGMNKIKYIQYPNISCVWNESNDAQPVAVGHVEQKTIREIYPMLKASNWTDDQINNLAKQYRNEYTNMNGCKDWWFQRVDENTKQWMWLDFTVDVMEFVYLTRNNMQYSYDEKSKKYRRNTGEDKDKEGYENYPCNFWYEGNYVIARDGADMIYGWQKMRNQMQDRLNPMCPYIITAIPGLSPIKRAIGHLDDIQYCVCKLRVAEWSAAPKGFTIDGGAAANIKIGGEEFNLFDMMEVFRLTGIRIVASKMTTSGQRTDVPLVEAENGLGQGAQEWINMIIHHTYMFMNDIGMNENMIGAPSQSAERLVGVIKQDIEAGNRGNWILQQYEQIFQSECTKRLIYQTIADIQNDEQLAEAYAAVIGEKNIQIVKEMDFKTLEQVGIDVEAVEIDKRKAEIMMRAVEMSKAMSRDGKVIVTQSQLEKVRQLLDNYEIKEAIDLLGYAEAESDAREKAWAQQMAQDTMKGQQESARISEEEKRNTILLKGDVDVKVATALADIEVKKTIAIEEAKSRFKVIEGEAGSENKKEEMVLEGTIEAKNKEEITGNI
jgi:hypothetical protein